MNCHTRCYPSKALLTALLVAPLLASACGEDAGDASDTALAKAAWAAISACDGAQIDDDTLELIAEMQVDRTGETRRRVTCAAGASDCTELYGCFHLTPSTTCAAESPTRCDGNAVVSCKDLDGTLYERRIPCGADGSGNTVCTEEGGWATCSSGTPCTGYLARCEGSTAVTCYDGVEERYHCASLGLHCLTRDLEQDVFCGEKSTPCQENHCDSGLVVICAGGYEQHRFACGSALPGSTCGEDTSDPYEKDVYCAAPDGAAQCQDGAGECAGAVARTCVGGVWFEVDCGAFMKGTCSDVEEELRCVVEK